jgi:hypothetical protein
LARGATRDQFGFDSIDTAQATNLRNDFLPRDDRHSIDDDGSVGVRYAFGRKTSEFHAYPIAASPHEECEYEYERQSRHETRSEQKSSRTIPGLSRYPTIRRQDRKFGKIAPDHAADFVMHELLLSAYVREIARRLR